MHYTYCIFWHSYHFHVPNRCVLCSIQALCETISIQHKMLPTTSVSPRAQSNGTLSSRDAARHTAGAKRYKYLRRLLHFRHMDFEFALWQMLYLFTSPQKVYRNFQYRKQTKDQWARDDPAFLVLLSMVLCGRLFALIMGCWLVRLAPCLSSGQFSASMPILACFHTFLPGKWCHSDVAGGWNHAVFWLVVAPSNIGFLLCTVSHA